MVFLYLFLIYPYCGDRFSLRITLDVPTCKTCSNERSVFLWAPAAIAGILALLLVYSTFVLKCISAWSFWIGIVIIIVVTMVNGIASFASKGYIFKQKEIDELQANIILNEYGWKSIVLPENEEAVVAGISEFDSEMLERLRTECDYVLE